MLGARSTTKERIFRPPRAGTATPSFAFLRACGGWSVTGEGLLAVAGPGLPKGVNCYPGVHPTGISMKSNGAS